MPARTAPGVRLLPNAITVLALCAGLSAVQFALQKQFQFAVIAIGAAAILDSLDGRLARMLDATSKMGAELDSLADAISFGVAPALVLFVWGFDGNPTGWTAALVYVVCMVLRLARFNTLLDDTEQPPFTKEFFVGVPAPAGALVALLPLVVTLETSRGWWTHPVALYVWMVFIAGLLISRVPTLSLKTVKVSPKAIAPLLALVCIAAAIVINYPFLLLAVAAVVYLAHVPYAIYRYRWLAKHPEAWDVPAKERRAIRRSTRRLGLRPPLRRRVAGAAVKAVRRGRRGADGDLLVTPDRPDGQRGHWRQLGLRRNERRRRDSRPD
ncbi:CDP-diacylglycerol--serine O-phosphatidyltransferase [Crossiella sp. SN42]|uniref:CDP-diacylglycerol--serine O-phosphatidyltransferase n=1 Tax=unclassified Crossiella TaxID=2620835 RepID=UPI00207C5A25|nr:MULTISPECIES: CDP-diacylglycerol--serine O-phosphatidyltransferase [unclassified Crossiella]MCO1579100.1 CDP-diacylglycerol--serine O-phosphatidyltransferase [Crossiella sp. SN42]WHT19951.1 CDP-diacylglycerol--serine O-phosphatidyltransferase [Crossiella sp. CA-258035]